MSTITNGNGTTTEKPVIRLCHIIKWEDYDGYGFNLHAEKSKPGQFIGKVDEGSPAEAAGLKEGDRIIEVNGQTIAGDDHKSVVSKIKQQPNEATLLVVDKPSAEYFTTNNITITSTLPEVLTMKTPARPAQTNGNGPITENGVVNEKTNGNCTATDATKTSSISSESPKSQRSATSSDSEKSKLNLNMSAEEFRNKLSLKKKYDPKKVNMDVKLKYEIIDQL